MFPCCLDEMLVLNFVKKKKKVWKMQYNGSQFNNKVNDFINKSLYPSHTALRERRDASVTETGRLLRDFYNTLCSGHTARLLRDSFTTD